jgi:release factor glutamine methyltransferase
MAVIGPLIRSAVRWLKPGGLLAVEHDDTTSAATVRMITDTGVFTDVTAHRDLTDRLRFVTARAQRGDRR